MEIARARRVEADSSLFSLALQKPSHPLKSEPHNHQQALGQVWELWVPVSDKVKYKT